MNEEIRKQVEEFIAVWMDNGGLEAIASIYLTASIKPRPDEFDNAFREVVSQRYHFRNLTPQEITEALQLEADIRNLETRAAQKCSEFTCGLSAISGYEQSLLWQTYRENNRQVRYGEESVTRAKQEFNDFASRLIKK